MLNLWIGMSRGVPELPTLLYDLEYREFAIEKRIVVSPPGTRRDERREVKPELILTSEAQRNTLLLEWKSGENTEREQIDRYRSVESEALERVFVPSPAASTHDVVYVGRAEAEARLRIGIEDTQCGFPLVVVSDELRLVLNSFSVSELTDGFAAGLPIDLANIPTGFVPIGPESPIDEVAEVVIPKVLEYMADRRSVITVEELAMATCGTWGVLDRSARAEVSARIAACLQEGARDEFSQYLSYSSSSGGRLTVRENPLELGAQRRTSAYQSLLTAQVRFLSRLSGRSVMELGEQLGLDLEEGEADT